MSGGLRAEFRTLDPTGISRIGDAAVFGLTTRFKYRVHDPEKWVPCVMRTWRKPAIDCVGPARPCRDV